MHQDHLLIPEANQPFFVSVKGNYVPMVKTPKNFYVYLRWTENYILKNKDREYINASAGGAHIEGARLMSLNEVLATYLKDTFVDAVKTLSRVGLWRDASVHRHIRSRVHTARKGLPKLDALLRTGQAIAEEMALVVEGKKKLKSAVDEQRFSKKAESFFKRLGRVRLFDLFLHTVKLDSHLMAFHIKQYRVQEKGFAQVIMRFPGLFKKVLSMSTVFQQALCTFPEKRRRVKQ
jgi:hypothetical protein